MHLVPRVMPLRRVFIRNESYSVMSPEVLTVQGLTPQFTEKLPVPKNTFHCSVVAPENSVGKPCCPAACQKLSVYVWPTVRPVITWLKEVS